jgi:hypothetical protein
MSYSAVHFIANLFHAQHALHKDEQVAIEQNALNALLFALIEDVPQTII